MSTDTRIIPTVDEVRAQCLATRQILEAYPLCLDATIDDYPIGRRERGQCRLQVERVKNKGYRTVRTTTDRHGRWCTPKKSVFRNDILVVVSELGGAERPVRWVGAGADGVYLQSANGEYDHLVKAPYYRKPQREEQRYTIVTQSVMLYSGQAPTREEREIVSPADPAALCDAYDEWLAQFPIFRALLLAVWKS